MMAARPASIAEVSTRNVERAPDRLCLRFEGEQWLYRLCERAENFAARVRDDLALTTEKVVGFCREDLAGYKKPRQVMFVNALPRNALGKVLEHEVRKKLIEAEE
jgi:acyl-coenzyme A synthetase/AMP-(fatty) acid ligase